LAGKSPAEAVNNYLDPLQRAVSCVTKGVLNVTGYHPANEPHVLALGGGRQGLKDGYTLTLEQRYDIVEAEGERGPWKVTTRGYIYALDDPDDREIVAYHWHPDGRSTEDRPHVHLGAGSGVTHVGLAGAHIPTSRVALEDFLLMCIEQFGIPAQRDDYLKILRETRGTFEEWRTWPAPGPPS
jgi:hypothetical protein